MDDENHEQDDYDNNDGVDDADDDEDDYYDYYDYYDYDDDDYDDEDDVGDGRQGERWRKCETTKILGLFRNSISVRRPSAELALLFHGKAACTRVRTRERRVSDVDDVILLEYLDLKKII